MDTIINAALEEICSSSAAGLPLPHLFQKLSPSLVAAGLDLSTAVKQAVWSNLVKIPGLEFRARDSAFEGGDARVQRFEECEGMELRVVAGERMRDCFLGLYDCQVPDSSAMPQRKVLERLAAARGSGVTQKQLSDKLGIRGNNFFYVVKSLESRGLIVRQSTILRKKGTSTNAAPTPVMTNLLHLPRYAMLLGSQQRLDITVEDKNHEESAREPVDNALELYEESAQEDVHVKNYLSAMKAVCDRLEEADGKVLVVSDIKRELGYRQTAGHRAWRNICGRLKQAGLVEVFDANLDDSQDVATGRRLRKSKPVSCLRLMKKFSLDLFERKTSQSGLDGTDAEQLSISERRSQSTEQLLELPIEQQIYDMIDSEGPRGLVAFEVSKRLGISNKKNHNRLSIMSSRFGLVQLPENHKRGTVYRCWTPRNFSHASSKSFSTLPECPYDNQNATTTADDQAKDDSQVMNLDPGLGYGNGEIPESGIVEEEPSCHAQQDETCNQIVLYENKLQCSVEHSGLSVSDLQLSMVNSVERPSQCSPKPIGTQRRCTYPSVTSVQREQRILEKIKEEGIILRCELQKWLEALEGGNKKIDRKTLLRCLKNLELEGHCKIYCCVAPGVTNYSHYREIMAILHSSVVDDEDLPSKVHERQRRFDVQNRVQASANIRNELPVPILTGIERIQNASTSDAQGDKSESMRTNGFVLAKMVRVRLLHIFLWGYVNDATVCNKILPVVEDLCQSTNPHSTCILFSLDAAVKAIPLELFLQVVGSARKFENMVEKCMSGFLLSGLPKDEYRCIVDTRATARLSWLIDSLKQLKLLRLVPDIGLKEGANNSHSTLALALELKPYIEEPPNTLTSFGSLDLRPHFRHDFFLSTKEAVEKYWQTLEYCYAAADPEAALHAFPGCVVRKVFHPRSWTTVRVMTVEQRAELQKRLNDAKDKRLTFQDCRGIAKDLNLNLEQVLRVYYDKKQRKRFHGIVEGQDDDLNEQGKKKRRLSKKSKISSVAPLSKHVEVLQLAECHEDLPVDSSDEADVNEEDDQRSAFIRQCAMPRVKQTRRGRFSWTEEADRKLLIQYARQRAIQGLRRGTDWAKIDDLPAPQDTCRRRIAILRKDINFTRALMSLCNLLHQRHTQHLDKNSDTSSFDIMSFGQGPEFPEGRWDDFEDPEIKLAFDEVLLCKQIVKVATKGTGIVSEGVPRTFSAPSGNMHRVWSQRARCRLPCKFANLFRGERRTARQLSESLAVSNAVELFKLVFLSSARSAEVPNLLADTLRCYSDHDLFSAFDYLREKKVMVGSNGSKPFVLSQHFLQNISSSQFPANTGKRATKFACWISEREADLMEGMVELTSDLQCGDIFHLLALVAAGELSISPLLPADGFGETEDSRGLKRKLDANDSFDAKNVKKKKRLLQEFDIFSRKEKGFPGLMVSLSRSDISRSIMVEFLKDIGGSHSQLDESDAFYANLGQKMSRSSHFDYTKEASDVGEVIPIPMDFTRSCWEVMSNYAGKVFRDSSKEQVLIHPDVFQNAYTAIQKAGDQGLCLSEVSTVDSIHGMKMAEKVVDVLQAFDKVLKVNSYDSFRVVGTLYRSKYFLTSKVARAQDLEKAVPAELPRGENNKEAVSVTRMCGGADETHKITILNLSGDVHQQPDVIGTIESNAISQVGEEDANFCSSDSVCCPILPWINGDGTTNKTVYRGLARRLLGIVMQSPGILEDNILRQMDVLNPQSCRQLLELMILDKHIIVRKMHQGTSGAPTLLKSLLGSSFRKPAFVTRVHYFANTMSAELL
ncbi:hypothetical protein Droror1_Dr00007449 [Drosera rotundifolia]